jgi:hypothetical protein
MPSELTTTCWRGLTISHPADWEISLASGVDEPNRCVFSDRRGERLDVRWRPLKAVPDLKHMIERYREKAPKGREDVRLLLLEDLPGPWSGIMQTSRDGRVVHVGRFFAHQRQLVEITLAWPEKRDTNLEAAVLEAIRPGDLTGSTRHWRAMGMDITVPRDYELVTHTSKIGKAHWIFEQGGRGGATLTFDRYAMTETWLRAQVRDWAEHEISSGRVVSRTTKQINGHNADLLLSRGWHGTLAALRGIRMLRLDLAWKCPTDTRLYHLILRRPERGENLDLPEGLAVRCCQPVPAAGGARP